MSRCFLARLCAAGLALWMLTGCGLTAPRGSDGFARLQSPGVFDTDVTLRLSIGPSLLRFAASQVDDDPATRALLRELEGVRVRLYEIDGDASKVAQRLEAMHAALRAEHWEPVVAVREANERTYMLVKTGERGVAGLMVLNSDGEEVVMVNVMGDLRPELFTQTMAALELEVPVQLPPESS